MRLKLAAFLALLTLAPCVIDGQSTTAYRYRLATRSDNDEFAQPVSTSAGGRISVVERDAYARIMRISTRFNGMQTGAEVYQYTGVATLPDSYELIDATGELSGRTRITRDASGNVIRYDNYTAVGEPTGYTTRRIDGDVVVETAYDNAGKLRGDPVVNSYSIHGFRIGARRSPNDSTEYATDYSELTGEALSRRKLVGGKVVSSNRYTYSDGSLVRDDIYSDDGVWYGARDYSDGLLRVLRYHFTDGTKQETRYSYSAKREATEAGLYRDGVLIVTFRYDRMSDGTVKRTLAIGPDGSLYAEYPNLSVSSVYRDGRPVDRGDAGIIYKNGFWW